MNTKGLLLIRTQAVIRMVRRLGREQQEELSLLAAELELIECLLAAALDNPEDLFETIIVDLLDNRVQAALQAIDAVLPGEDAS